MALVLGLGGAGVAAAAWIYGQGAARQAYDTLLIGTAQQIAQAIRVVDGAVSVDIPVSAFQLLALAPDDRVFYAVTGPDGRLITGDDLPPAPDGAGRFWSVAAGAERARFVREARPLAEPGLHGEVTVIVGQTTRARDLLAARITRNALIVTGLAGAAVAGLAIMAARAALRPLSRIEEALAARRAHDQSPLAVAVPTELSGLVATLNDQRARVDRILSSQRKMIADASHQLRTPIAGLRAQAELARQETDPARLAGIVTRIHGAAVDLSRLADQLLSRSLIIHRADAVSLVPLDLRAVALDAAEQLCRDLPQAAGDLVLDLAEGPVSVRGDALSLIEAAKNLIQNALTYGRPAVTIRVRDAAPDGTAALAVVGRGTGPDPGRPVRGTGLGLGIADAVARPHDGRLTGAATAEGWQAALLLPGAGP
ncbi:hypothetical protein B0A89_14215 (plasmid) [Paracoccus contaminans]|uniref:histidine kinase n=1 Tax=Paracoccus contaminans TaxID=1945662 RepID=A0A1W6D1N1_9RHOB|nr:hypothetical protein B0A89_14215 [Paracoccus contaminans]